jgi:DHA2 family multidrug resistance protein-like MFS transporter
MTIEATDGLPVPRRYWAILVIVLGVTMAVLDGAIANVALPTIARELNASAAQSVWVVNAYQLVIMVSLLALSSLGEIVGYARIYRIGIAVFGVASLACALSDSLTTLVLARILQGVGAACIMSVNTALLRFIYPRAQLGRGMGFNAFIVALASAVGPTVAAGILSVASWQWIFAINVPLSAITFLLIGNLPAVKRASRRFDMVSAALTAITFGLFIIGIDGLGEGFDHLLRVGVQLAVAGACGFWLVRRQLDETAPLLPVDLMRIPLFALSVCTSVLSFAAQMLSYVALPFYFQNVLGRDAVQTGLLMTPWPIAIMFVAPLAGRLSDRYPAGVLGAIGMAAFASGLALMAFLPADPTSGQIVWRMVVCGAGFALFQSPNNRTLIGSAPMERTGGASGMLGTARLLGQTTGTALVALIFNLFPHGETKVALLTAACFALAAMGMSSLRLTPLGRTARQEGGNVTD